MDRIHTPALDQASGATADVYAQIRQMAGSVPNTFAVIGAHGPEALQAVLHADGVLAAGTLSKQDLETIKLLVSEAAGCDYCVAAHTMLGKMTGLKSDTLTAIRAGEPTGDDKRDALVRFVNLLQRTSGTIGLEYFAAIKEAGYTDRQLVEISLAVAVTSFTNVFNRINDTAVDFPAVK